MDSKVIMSLYIFVICIPILKGGNPGTFFWRPRLGVDLTIPTVEANKSALKPNYETMRQGYVVILEGYQAGMTLIGLASGISSASTNLQLNPLSAYYYTNVYRWWLRYLSLVPFWVGGTAGHFCETHKVWNRRFYYMDEFVPKWLRPYIFFVKKEEWEKEEAEFKRFKKYAEPAFGKHFRYPTKIFNDFLSQYTNETMEPSGQSSESIEADVRTTK